ncbi:MAG: cellulase family glycosylhydrolase [bacterium]|nr:cellulase family glycosylhydrolase [bacterium]
MSSSKLLTAVCALFIVTASAPGFAKEIEFLHTRGTDIVTESGEKVMPRGLGLGNWLLPEGYMWKFGDLGDRPRKIEKIVSDLIGDENAERFWLEFRRNYITEADIARIAELGFNSVRPALNARRFMTETDPPEYVGEGFELLDNLIAWCKKYGVYVIIDMHGAPGGQTGQNIDDSPNNEPELFSNPENQDRLEALWVKIAGRYKDEAIVAGYDLLNEPLPQRTGAAEKYKDQLEPLYKRLTAAIRKVDPKHMITVEGCDWANDWSVFSEPFDDNLVYQFHYYCWDNPSNLKSVQKYIDFGKKWNVPVWVGETGERDNAIYWGTTQYFEANNIGWSFWPWKKMDASNAPYSIPRPDGWDEIAGYSRGRAAPSKETAQKAFDQLLENIKLENCDYYPDVVNAILRRVPGRIECENYGHEGAEKSYHVSDDGAKSEFYRKNEPVKCVTIETGQRRRSVQGIQLSADEWTAYDFTSPKGETCTAAIRLKVEKEPAAFKLLGAKNSWQVKVNNTDWETVEVNPIPCQEGENHLQLQVINGTIEFDWIELKP